jgi:hypothetical protein
LKDTADDHHFGRRAILFFINDIERGSSRAGENPISRIEDNIENAMDVFRLDSHYKDVSEFGRSYRYSLKDMRLGV